MSPLRMAALAILLTGCASVRAPTTPAAAAELQADTSADLHQATLWRQAAKAGTVADLHLAAAPRDPVRSIAPLLVPDRAAANAPVSYSREVLAGLSVVAAPELDRRGFSGQASVRSLEGELITLDLGAQRLLTLRAKVRGGPVRASVRDAAQVVFRQGDPFRRADVLGVKLPSDDLVYALVGGQAPVSLAIPTHDLVASQVGDPARNSMRVRMQIGPEVHELEAGGEVEFTTARLTVTVVASVAAQGEAAGVLAEPYRLEVLGWRTTR